MNKSALQMLNDLMVYCSDGFKNSEEIETLKKKEKEFEKTIRNLDEETVIQIMEFIT